MVALHLVLVLRRLGAEGKAGGRLGRALSESFVVDMDDVMREMTFGDLAVPREVKRAAAALFDRHQAYLAGLQATGTMALQDALETQLAYLGCDGHLDTSSLADFARHAASALDGQPAAQVLGGQLVWPDLPAGIKRSDP